MCTNLSTSDSENLVFRAILSMNLSNFFLICKFSVTVEVMMLMMTE